MNFRTCIICEKSFKNKYSLASHIRYNHDVSCKEYYDKYIKKKLEGLCIVCGKSTRYKSIELGYTDHCSCKCARLNRKKKINKGKGKGSIICKICGFKVTTMNGLSQHCKSHKISVQDYYDKYLKKYVDEDICNNKNCNKQVKFVSITQGYQNYCNGKCSNTCDKVKQKYMNTMKEKYGSKKRLSIIKGKGNQKTRPEKIVEDIIQNFNYDYEYNKYIKTTKRGRFPDFILTNKEVIIEVDGEYWHKEKDFNRDIELMQEGYTIIHIPAKTIENNVEKVYFSIVYFVMIEENLNFYNNKTIYLPDTYNDTFYKEKKYEVYELCQKNF